MLRICINKIENLISELGPIESDQDLNRVIALKKCLHKLQNMQNDEPADLDMRVLCRYLIGVIRAYHDTPSILFRLVPQRYLHFTHALLILYRHELLSPTRALNLYRFFEIEPDSTPSIVAVFANEGLLAPKSFDLVFNPGRLAQLTTALASPDVPPLPHFVLANLYLALNEHIPYDDFLQLAKDPVLCREAHGLIENFDAEGINITPRILGAIAKEIEYSGKVLLAITMLQLHFLQGLQPYYTEECLTALISSARYCDCTNLIVTLQKYQLITPELLIVLCNNAKETKTDLSILIDCLDASKVLPDNSIDILIMLLSFMPFIDAVQPAVIALHRFRKLDRSTFQSIVDEPDAALAIMLDKIRIYDLQNMIAKPEFKAAHPKIVETIKKAINAAVTSRYFYLTVYRNEFHNTNVLFRLPPENLDSITSYTAEGLDPKVIRAIVKSRM